MSDVSSQDGVLQPREWGMFSATFWSIAAFFVPQLALVPFIGFMQYWSINENAKIFILQGFVHILTLVLLWLVITRLYHADIKSIGLNRLKPSLLWLSLLLFPLYIAVSTAVSSAVSGLFGINLQEQQNIGYANPNGLELVLIFVALVVLAPFVEEVLFRGFLFRAFRRVCGFLFGSIIVSLLFAVAHGQVNVGVDVFVLSMFLCYLREKTDTLWTPIALHSLKNLVAFVLLFIIKPI